MTWIVGGGAVALGALAWGWFEAGWLRKRVLEVELEGASRELDGVRIAHLSDLHLGVPGRGRRAAEEAVAWVVERRPDLVFVTGDLVSRRDGLPLLERLLTQLPGCIVVLGNHDFADSRDPFSERIDGDELDRLEGVTLLFDECDRGRGSRSPRPDRRSRSTDLRALRVPPGRARRPDRRPPHPPLSLPGCRAACSRGLVRPDPRRALPRRSDRRAVPGTAGCASRTSVRETWKASTATAPTALHVSPGIGTTFVPFRFFARPEVTELVVRSA